jgi:hypothetical protein
MEKCCARMQADEGEERFGTKLVGPNEEVADFRIRRQQHWHFPDEQFKGVAAEQDPAQARDRLHEKQDIKAIFIGLCDRLLQPRHALGKWRQVSEIVPPEKAHQSNDPNQYTRRSVRCQNCRSEGGIVVDGFAQPGARKLADEEEYGKPMKGHAYLIETSAFGHGPYGESFRGF